MVLVSEPLNVGGAFGFVEYAGHPPPPYTLVGRSYGPRHARHTAYWPSNTTIHTNTTKPKKTTLKPPWNTSKTQTKYFIALQTQTITQPECTILCFIPLTTRPLIFAPPQHNTTWMKSFIGKKWGRHSQKCAKTKKYLFFFSPKTAQGRCSYEERKLYNDNRHCTQCPW